MSESTNLEPCPNRECRGSEPVVGQHPQVLTSKAVRVVCLGCQTSGPLCKTEAEARRLWNALPRDEPADAATGPGEATRRILSTLARKQAEAVKTTEEYALYVWPSPWGDREITFEIVAAALRECGMEAES